ncbi:LOW QUALITY PROTEIN: cell cycle and apoptosis regulator protein 2 [Chanos chanos]|uniref:LOW QUALITY PROTEIN: cell cycle and apoptosis regulator protein 2 n=1 Tax=Chanos chanos TaxID=29144 RepID=A0A6J2UWW4_CHACN|nr:LOW QUALITY PROTEIN: cell cycle and apoptosis regulator protein 2-like [Chanos chanos]
METQFQPQMRQRVFTGVVTQLQDHHGMVDQEVHFKMSVVIGRAPLLGEKVLVKAVLDPSQSINWTAQRVQTLNGQPFKSPPPLLPSMATNQKPGILGSKPQPLLKSPKIPPLIPCLQTNPAGLLQIPPHHGLPWSGPYEGWAGGNRKRHSEAVGGRRGGRWEDSGAWGGDGMHQKKRRWKTTSEEEIPKKSASAPPESVPLFSCFPRDSVACDSLELQRRYPHLHAPPMLFHLQLCWTESFPPARPLPLCGPCLFHLGSSQSDSQPTPSDPTDSSYTVKVMLLSMPSIEDFYAQCCNLSEDSHGPQGGAVHPTTLFKFLLIESAGELQLPGGLWSKVDGPNPGKDGTSLIHTAVRCVKEQTALDLSACAQWHKMAELSYLCGERVETVVFLLPDVWDVVPTQEEWASLQNQAPGEQKADGSPLPDVPSLVVHPSPGLSLAAVPLSSLLEVRNTQSRESFEVSLMGELFSEMLQRDFGLQLYYCLCSLPQGPSSPHVKAKANESEDSSTPTEDEPKTDKQKKKKVGKEARSKRSCQEKEEEPMMESVEGKEEREETENQAENDKESKGVMDGERVSGGVSENLLSNDSDRPLGWTAVLPRRVLLSWVFFDRQLVGSLREQDLKNILLSLGLYLTSAQAGDLVRKTTVDGQCVYRKLCSCWEDLDVDKPDFSTEGNRELLPKQPSKERGPTRRSAGGGNADVVNYKGTSLNIPNLLQSLETSKMAQRELEKRLSTLQSRLVALEAEVQQGEQEDLRSRLEKAETLNRTFEKSLKENAGHMITFIEKMQKMVAQTTRITGKTTTDEQED